MHPGIWRCVRRGVRKCLGFNEVYTLLNPQLRNKTIDVIISPRKKTKMEKLKTNPNIPQQGTRNMYSFKPFSLGSSGWCVHRCKPAKRWSPEAQGQRASWAKHLSWTYGILGKELVDEGRSRLRRFRQYVRKPGSWMMPSWKEVIKWVKMFKSLMISDAVELVVDGWSTAAPKKTTGTCLGVKNLGKVWWFQPTSPWIVRGLARGNHSKWFWFRGWGFFSNFA